LVAAEGVDIVRLAGDDVRRVVGLLTDDARLFDTTIAENLRIAVRDADESTLRDALDRVRLLDWVDSLPDGLETMVGERGGRLSGGQRRRLALARALLADFPVLVLDEPTEHLDPGTAEELTADLLVATRGHATVLITHRPAGLAEVDEIVVLDQGRVVQRGSHLDLITVDGPYRRLVNPARRVSRGAPPADARPSSPLAEEGAPLPV
jgi:ATP-binding cassette subfamily C protein CydCD